MTAFEDELTVYECRSCGDYQLSPIEVTCCGTPMSELDSGVPVEPPDEECLMRTVFGISETGFEVCGCLMAGGEMTVEEVAERIDRDRTVVTRHLNHLVDLGMVEKQSRVLPEGGRRNVYAHRSADVVRKQFELGLYVWMADSVDVIDNLSEEKIARMVLRDDPETSPDQVIVDRDESA